MPRQPHRQKPHASRLRRSAQAILSALLLASACAAAAPLEIMVEDAASPWSNPDGSGLANAVVKAAFAAAQVDIKLLVVPYARCKAFVMAGHIPACLSMSWEPKFKGLIAFSNKPIFAAHIELYSNEQNPISARKLDDIPSGTVVGIVNGYEYPESFQAMRQAGVIFDYSPSETVSLKKLEAGRIRLAVLMLDGIKTDTAIMAEAGASNVAHLFSAGEQGSFVGFSTRHAKGEFARTKYNEGYDIIARNGTLKAISAAWTGRR